MKEPRISACRACMVFAASLLAAHSYAATVTVDCDAGGRIAPALASLKSGDSLVVSGTCRESVFVPRHLSGITLDGQGKATIQAGPADVAPTGPADFAIFVLGQDITIKGLRIIGGSHGIHLSGPATVVISGNVIRESGGAIHLDKGSIGQIFDNVIEDNRGFGIQLIENSYARIGFRIPTLPKPQPNVIRNNDGHGIFVARRSSAWIVGNTIQGNKGHGVFIDRNSQADVVANTISANRGDGVRATHNAGVNFSDEGSERSDGPNQTEPASTNGGAGVRCAIGGYVAGPLGQLNGRDGARRIDASCIDRIAVD